MCEIRVGGTPTPPRNRLAGRPRLRKPWAPLGRQQSLCRLPRFALPLRRIHNSQVEAIRYGVVAVNGENVCHDSTMADAGDVHDEVNGQGDRLSDTVVRKTNVGREHAVCKSRQSLLGRVGVNGAETTGVPGVKSLKQIERLGSTYLAYQDSIWPVSQRRAEQVGDRDGRERCLLTKAPGSELPHRNPRNCCSRGCRAAALETEGVLQLHDQLVGVAPPAVQQRADVVVVHNEQVSLRPNGPAQASIRPDQLAVRVVLM